MIFCFLNLEFLWNLWLVIPLVIGRLLVFDDLQYTAISCMVMYLFPFSLVSFNVSSLCLISFSQILW